VVAGDGTVIQAAASRYVKLRSEVAGQAAQAAREAASGSPGDEKLEASAEHKERVAKVESEREGARQAKGRDKPVGVVCSSEPNAVIQQLKNHAVAPSYKPSVVANTQRIIVGKTVEPSNEVKAVRPMIEQAERIGGPSTAHQLATSVDRSVSTHQRADFPTRIPHNSA